MANMLELLVLARVEVFEKRGGITRSYRKRPGGRGLRRRPSGVHSLQIMQCTSYVKQPQCRGLR